MTPKQAYETGTCTAVFGNFLFRTVDAPKTATGPVRVLFQTRKPQTYKTLEAAKADCLKRCAGKYLSQRSLSERWGLVFDGNGDLIARLSSNGSMRGVEYLGRNSDRELATRPCNASDLKLLDHDDYEQRLAAAIAEKNSKKR